jgi:hypothetical protein
MVLATMAARRMPAGEPDAPAGARLELATAIEDRAARAPGAEADIRRRVRALPPPDDGRPRPDNDGPHPGSGGRAFAITQVIVSTDASGPAWD